MWDNNRYILSIADAFLYLHNTHWDRMINANKYNPSSLSWSVATVLIWKCLRFLKFIFTLKKVLLLNSQFVLDSSKFL